MVLQDTVTWLFPSPKREPATSRQSDMDRALRAPQMNTSDSEDCHINIFWLCKALVQFHPVLRWYTCMMLGLCQGLSKLWARRCRANFFKVCPSFQWATIGSSPKNLKQTAGSFQVDEHSFRAYVQELPHLQECREPVLCLINSTDFGYFWLTTEPPATCWAITKFSTHSSTTNCVWQCAASAD